MNGDKSSQTNNIHPRVLKDSTMKELKYVLYQGNVSVVSVKSFFTNLLVFSKGINENLDKRRMLDISCMESSIGTGTFQPGTKKEGGQNVIGISIITNVVVSKEQLITLPSSRVTTK